MQNLINAIFSASFFLSFFNYHFNLFNFISFKSSFVKIIKKTIIFSTTLMNINELFCYNCASNLFKEALRAQICAEQKYRSFWFDAIRNPQNRGPVYLHKLFWPACISFLLNINLLINSISTLLQLSKLLTLN